VGRGFADPGASRDGNKDDNPEKEKRAAVTDLAGAALCARADADFRDGPGLVEKLPGGGNGHGVSRGIR
jgi:hypothetical protein